MLIERISEEIVKQRQQHTKCQCVIPQVRFNEDRVYAKLTPSFIG